MDDICGVEKRLLCTRVDALNVEEFLAAQDPIYSQVKAELKSGRKVTHWMWFIFPQLSGLGSSAMAQKFGLRSLEDARTYLHHPVLGSRLRECARLLIDLEEKPIQQILGAPDDLKLRSCLTLFSAAAPEETLFRQALNKYFDGAPDAKTLQLIRRTSTE